MIWRNRSSSDAIVGSVRIEPGMKFKASFVRFFNHKLKRFVIRLRRCSLHAGKPVAPGFKRRWIKCIRGGPYLNNNGVHTIHFMHVQLTDIIGLLAIYIKIVFWRPVNIIYGGDPHSAKFIRRLCFGEKSKKQRKKKQNSFIHLVSAPSRNLSNSLLRVSASLSVMPLTISSI